MALIPGFFGRRVAKCACHQPLAAIGADAAIPKTVVTLVHGTFAQHAPWMRGGSPLRETIDGDGVLVRCFCWSGRNRHRDRVLAGYALQQQLETLLARYPSADHHVIAHSHGGNVAVYALADERDIYMPELARVKLTTLATPFLNFRPMRLTWGTRFTLLLTLLLGLLGLMMAPATAFNANETALARVVVSTFYALMVAALFAFPVTAIMYLRARSWREVKASFGLVFGRGIENEIVRLRTARSSPNHLVVLGAGDEASDLLGAAQLVSWLGHQLIGMTLKRSLIVGLALGLVWAPWLYVDEIALGSSAGEAFAVVAFVTVTMVLLAPFYLPFLCVVVMVFIPWPAMAFGTDSLFLSIHTIMSVTVAPEGRADVLIAKPHGELVHGLYENPTVLEAIRVRLGGAVPPPPIAAAIVGPTPSAPPLSAPPPPMRRLPPPPRPRPVPV